MKLQTKISLTFAGTFTVVAIAGCPNMLPGTTTGTDATPAPVAPASKLKGRLTLALNETGGTNASGDLGAEVVLKLKRKRAGESVFTTLDSATTSTDVKGNYMFTNLENGDYQVVFDDGGKTIETNAGFNVAGVAVSDAVSVSTLQTVIPEVNMELGWNFLSGSNYSPDAGATLNSRSNVAFQWNKKLGYDNAIYRVSVFHKEANGDMTASISSPSATVGTDQLQLTFGLPSTDDNQNPKRWLATPPGVNYYVVKYYKSGNGNGWGSEYGNYYGQTKLIKITLP